MAKENQNKKYDGQNRCKRCDRPLKDPTANYGWWCAKLVGLDRYKQIFSALDENATEIYNRYMVDYLYKDSKTPVNNVAIANYNDQGPTNQGTEGILNTGYDEAGVWHDWDAGKHMFQYAVDMFVNPGDYNFLGQQCDDVASKILSAGGIGYENKLLPNSSYEMYKQNKTYWMNETGISRGVEL